MPMCATSRTVAPGPGKPPAWSPTTPPAPPPNAALSPNTYSGTARNRSGPHATRERHRNTGGLSVTPPDRGGATSPGHQLVESPMWYY